MPMTLEQAQAQHDREVDANRREGVIEWRNTETQSDRVFEVVEGKAHLTDPSDPKKRIVVGQGHRIHPTEAQLKQIQNRKGGLYGKVRELTGTEYDALGRRAVSPGANIGLRQFRMAEGTMRYAMDVGLTEDDFRGVEPEGSAGYFTRTQVEAIAESRTSPAA
jgi:hypothetical protein